MFFWICCLLLWLCFDCGLHIQESILMLWLNLCLIRYRHKALETWTATHRNTFADFHQHISGRRINFVQKLSTEKDENRDDHQSWRNTKTQRIAVLLLKTFHTITKKWRDTGRDERAKIDGKVEDREKDTNLLGLLWQFELFTTESCNAWLNSTRSDSNQSKSNECQSPVDGSVSHYQIR